MIFNTRILEAFNWPVWEKRFSIAGLFGSEIMRVNRRLISFSPYKKHGSMIIFIHLSVWQSPLGKKCNILLVLFNWTASGFYMMIDYTDFYKLLLKHKTSFTIRQLQMLGRCEHLKLYPTDLTLIYSYYEYAFNSLIISSKIMPVILIQTMITVTICKIFKNASDKSVLVPVWFYPMDIF
jgi:hypothetical protein